MDIYFDLRTIENKKDFFELAKGLLNTAISSDDTLYRALKGAKDVKLILLYGSECAWLDDDFLQILKKAHRHQRKFHFRVETAGRKYGKAGGLCVG